MSEGTRYMICGSSGSGKTAYVLQLIQGVSRLLAWDPEGEFASKPDITQVGYKGLVHVATAGTPGRFAFVPPKGSADFEFWARAAWCYAQTPGQKTIIADETSDVTHSGKASGAWGQIIRRGRKHGADVIGITQSPAESDKTLLKNANIIHICSLWELLDQKYMSERTGIPIDEIKSLQADKETGVFEYLQIDRGKKTTRRDRLIFD